MWKRFQGHGREKERHAQIGNPVLLETTYDEDQLRRNPYVADVQRIPHLHSAPPPPPLLSYSLALEAPPNYRASEFPAVSESPLYSQPSHDLTYYHENPTATQSAYEDISPPSSPDLDQLYSASTHPPRRFHSMRDVSPVDEDRKNMDSGFRTGSNIPVLKRAPPALQTGELNSGPKQKFWEGKLAPNSKVKWDVYSGEPTSSNAGRASSVTPGTYAHGAAHSVSRPMGHQVTVSGPERKVSLAERVSRFGARQAAVEPWSKATGRSEIAPPLRDDPSKRPLQLPRKASSPTSKRKDVEVPNARDVVAHHDTSATDTSSVTSETRSPDLHNDLIKPIVPLKVGRNTPPRSGLTSPTSPTNPGLGIHPFVYSSPTTPTNRNPLPVPEAPKQSEVAAAELHPAIRSTTPPYHTADGKVVGQTPEKDKQAPTSRFSWTTYNSGTTYQHSPPPSPPTLLAAATPVVRQRVVTEPISAASSILSRRRPVPQADRVPEALHPIRKSTPTNESPATTTTARIPRTMLTRSPVSPYAASIFSTASTSTTKALPVPPTSLSAHDHVSLLESQMDDLRIRRSNVYRLLSDLNNAAPPNPLLTDYKTARVVEQRKKVFEEELCEIKREEHEVGMKLHRAWKKREREDPNAAGSALWVRRVTS
ncbi:hypothetical protein ACN47E_005710 [Coniothyrium glycines]